ncbi:glycoside hydrolase family 2 TIM barrel-domain containing protein [Granulicella sp. dw_53]|uniref:glycoside hydrolase family 2 protein n=1 Tax=Granulicella sp. dw_53 TaxID=2719792 RepID=UPI001BD275D1|nr:glycoside hydrolase family 2 TIM barrel-domain containing protein [Granulicella sp. dw_53]
MSNLCTRILLTLLVVPCIPAALAQTTLSEPTVLVDIDHRDALSLNGDWHYIVDPYFGGLYSFHREIKKDGYFMDADPASAKAGPIEYNFAKSPILKVPGDFNTQHDSLFYYEGPLWYERKFDFTPKAASRVFFHIGAANYRAKLWVNGQHICDHEGGFTPFDCEVTQVVKPGQNSVVINVDNTRIADGVPTLNTDWWNYGGLTRDVSILSVPEAFVDDYELHLDRATRTKIEGYVHVEHATSGTKVHLTIPELKVAVDATTDAAGRAAIALTPQNLELWSPETPKLYKVTIASGSDTLTDDMGFRTIETRGTQILLNGKPVFLRGMSVHAEAPYRTGRANTEQDVTTLITWAQELGCNFLRLAHYPHDQRMTRAADRMGVLIWSEIPTYWALHFDDPAVLAKAQQQLRENIRRDRDKASVILWSVANETPNTPARTTFLSTLAANAHELDPTRLVTAALLVRAEGHTESGDSHVKPGEPNVKIVDDPLGKALDVIGANEYIGWYEKTPEDAANTVWKIAYDKPLIMSEFGGDARFGLHGSEHERWTEEYQSNIYRNQIVMLNKIPQLRGMSPWILMDFRSPVRVLPGVQDNFNRKGLISPEGQKKQAFFILQKAYKDKTLGKAE